MNKLRKLAERVLGGTSDMSRHEIAFIVSNIGPDLQKLARELGLSHTQVTELNQSKEGLEEKAHKMISWWIQREGRRATKREMTEKLRTIQRNDIADALAEWSHLNADEELLTDFTQLQRRLMKRYSRYCIPQPPNIKKDLPIDDIFIYQEMEKHRDVDNRKETIELKDFFKPVYGGDPVTRILVEGDPGFGKTTLAFKLGNDWAKGMTYIASKFNLVMLLPLREMETTGLEDFVVDIIRRAIDKESFTKHDLNSYLSQYKVLLILDGYDEMSIGARTFLNDILEKEKLKSSCILVTSRRGIFTTKKSFESSTSSMVFHKVNCEFWDTKVLLKGVTPDQRMQILKNNFQINPDSIRKIDRLFSDNANEIFRCALFVFWLGWMLEREYVQQIDTRTTFYKRLLNLILHKTLVRKSEMSESYKLDVFESTDDNKVVSLLRTQIEKFGNMALNRLLVSHDLTFTEKELGDLSDSTLLNSDIFVKYKSISNKEEETIFQPMHKTFLEFVTACSICSLANNESYHQFQAIITGLVRKRFGPSLNSFLFPFIAGLLGNNAHLLFNSLSPWSAIYHVNTPEMINVLLEVHQANDEIIQSLLKFVTNYHRIRPLEGLHHYFLTECHTKLFQQATAKELISVLMWDISAFHLLPVKVLRVKKLCLRTSDVHHFETLHTASVHCDELICHISVDLSENLWNEYLSAFSTIVAKQISLCLRNLNVFTCALIFTAIKQDKWHCLTFHRVEIINCWLEKNDFDLLIDLVSCNRIEKGILICLGSNPKLTAGVIDRLWEATVRSSSLDEFSFINEDDVQPNPVFDMSLLSGTATESLYFSKNFNLHDDELASSSMSIDKLMLENNRETSNDVRKILRNVTGTRFLHCDDHLFTSKSFQHLPFLSTLTELYLTIHNDFSLPSSFSATSTIPNLKSLTLDFQFLTTVTVLEPIKNFLTTLLNSKQLHFLGLHFCEATSEMFDFLNVVFRSSSDVELQCLEFAFEDTFEMEQCYTLMHRIMALIRTDQLKQLVIVDLHDVAELRSVLPVLFPENDFTFVNETNGSKSEHSISSQHAFERFMLLRHQCCIRRKIN